MSSSNILISNLQPPQPNSISSTSNTTTSTSTPISFSIKLTNDLIQLLKNHSNPNNKIKLIVKNGNISIKLSNDLIFPCLPLPENLTVDLYSIPSNKDNFSKFDGRIINKLTIITDPKKIKEINSKLIPSNTSNTSSSNTTTTTTSLSVPSSPINQRSTYSIYSNVSNNPYKIFLNKDNQHMIIKKLIHLLALGPITYNHIVKLLDYSDFDSILYDYGQLYNDQDQFIQEDRFPYIDSSIPNKNDYDDDYSDYYDDHEVQRFILKDKSYKELRPWKWNYTTYERNSILNNVNNALTRIGFSQSHPLRKKIVEPSNENDKDIKKPNTSSLGGGFLISSSSSSSSSKKKSTPTPISSKSNTPVISTSTSTPVTTTTTTTVTAPALTSSKINSPIIHSSSSSKNNTPVIRPPSRNYNNTPSPSSKLKLNTITNNNNNNNNNNNKRKFSSSSSSSEDDDSKKLNYTSPPSSEEESIGGGTTTNSSSSNNGSGSRTINNKDSKLEYYTNLAMKFKNKYKEYSELYNSLLTKNDIKPIDYKENLLKLFKLHQNLSQWKKILWNFDKEIKSKNTLSGLHIEKNTTTTSTSNNPNTNNTNNTNTNTTNNNNTTNNTSSILNTSSSIKITSPSNTVIDAHPPGIRTATPFKRRKVMDY